MKKIPAGGVRPQRMQSRSQGVNKMAVLPIVEKGKPVACHADWPLFYMNDFSRLGLTVNRLSDALAILRSDGYAVHADDQGAALEVSGQSQIVAAVAALRGKTIDCELADLVACVYQG